MAQKHYINVRDWPKTLDAAAKARIATNVNDESHPAAKLYWWKEANGTPEDCEKFCANLVAGSLKRGNEAYAKATTPAPVATEDETEADDE